jgi:hypothetical protein
MPRKSVKKDTRGSRMDKEIDDRMVDKIVSAIDIEMRSKEGSNIASKGVIGEAAEHTVRKW